MKLYAFITALCLLLASPVIGQVQTNNPGTKMRVIPTTSALWRSILPTETPSDFLEGLGFTNLNGVIVTTNFVGGRFITEITSINKTVSIAYATNQDGTMAVDLSVSITNLSSVVSNVVFGGTNFSTIVSNLIFGGTNIYQVVDATNLVYSPFDFAHIINMNTNVASQTLNTNAYWVDMGRTNSLGQTNVYGELQATNDVFILGPTNNIRGSLYSFRIIATGGNRTIYFTNTLTYFDTNGWSAASSGVFTKILTNGNFIRFSFQQGGVLESMQRTFGQP